MCGHSGPCTAILLSAVCRSENMNAKRIILLVAIPAAAMVTILFASPIVFLALGNLIGGYIISATPNEVFEEEFAEIPEVSLFIAKYPNYTTSHGGDIIGWKIILYNAEHGDDPLLLQVKKNVFHQGIRVHIICADSSLSSDVQDDIMAYIQSGKCFKSGSAL